MGLWLVGAPLALTLALLAAMLEIIPNVGPVLWLVPAAGGAAHQGTTQVVHVVGIYVVTHVIESYVLIPLVQRRAVLLPPALSILAVRTAGPAGRHAGPVRGRAAGAGRHVAGEECCTSRTAWAIRREKAPVREHR